MCPTFAAPDLDTFARLDVLGLEVVGQYLEPDRAVLACPVQEPDRRFRRCGYQGAPRDTVCLAPGARPAGVAAHDAGGHTVRQFQCTGCGRVWRQDLSAAAEPRSKISRGALARALCGLVVAHLTVARVAEGLTVSGHTANDLRVDARTSA